MNDIVTWGAIAVAVASIISIVTFWTKYSDRITKAEGKAGIAVEVAKAARDEVAALRAEMVRDRAEHVKEVTLLRSESIKELAELAAKIYRVEIWSRDEFVRKGSFETVVSRLEKGMEQLGSKVEGAVERMSARIENLNHNS